MKTKLKFRKISKIFKFPKKISKKILNHIVIIPDGNRRWAIKKGLPTRFGHTKAAEYKHIISLSDEVKKWGIQYVSFWGLSTENWNKRSEKEKNNIFTLILQNIKKLKKDTHKNKLRFRHLGRKDRLPKKLLKAMEELEKETKKYNQFNFQLCLDYGGRDEILRTVNKIIKDKKKKVDERVFRNYLDSKDIPDPDLIIRTSNEKRLSGFMPFQSSYAELYFSKKHFPVFTSKDLRKAIKDFSKRKRRFGC